MARFLNDPPVWEGIRQDERALDELDDRLNGHECEGDECDFPEAHGSHQVSMMLARKLLWLWEATEMWAAWMKDRGYGSKGIAAPERALMMAVGAMEPDPNCDHAKVYSWDYQPGDPPKWKWICSECLAAGEDGLVKDPVTDQDRYWKLAMMRMHCKVRDK